MVETTTSTIRGRDQVFALEKEYHALYDKVACPNVYMSPAWVYTWLLSLGRTYEPVFMICRIDGTLAGIWPFFECRLPVLGTALLPAGAHASDAFDPVGIPEALDPLFDELVKAAADYAFAWLPLVSRDLAEGVIQRRIRGNKHLGMLRKRTPRYLIDLRKFKDFSNFMDVVFGPKTRQSLRRKTRRLFEQGPLEYLTLEKPEEITPWIGKLAALEQKSWKANEGGGILQNPAQRAFYHVLLENLAARGQVRLGILQVGNSPVAYEIGVLGKDYYCMHSMGYDLEFAACSPGRLLMLQSIDVCLREKRRVYDFMQNDQEFKRQMSTRASSLWDCIIFPPNLRGTTIRAVVGLVYTWTEWRRRGQNRSGALERDEVPESALDATPD